MVFFNALTFSKKYDLFVLTGEKRNLAYNSMHKMEALELRALLSISEELISLKE